MADYLLGSEVGARLEALGISLISNRWPYTYHHDWFRAERGPELSRLAVTQMMNRFKTKYGYELYESSIILGAVAYLAHTDALGVVFALTSDARLRELLRPHVDRVRQHAINEVSNNR